VSLQTQPPSLDWPHYGISFGGAITRGFKKYAKFNGRASRSEYWWWALFTALVITVIGALTLLVGSQTSSMGSGSTPGAAMTPLILLLGLFYLAVLVPSIALSVRRLHDVGYTGWLVLLTLIPYLGSLILLIFAVLPSSPAGAKYDPPSAYPPASYPPAEYPPSPYQPTQYPPA